MDDAEAKAWQAELNKTEQLLLEAIAIRAKPCMSPAHTLKLAFRAVDFDERGYGVETGGVNYTEFCNALERFGFYPSQAVRGLFDRYNAEDADDLNYAAFSDGLYGEHKPWPPPAKRPAEECQTASQERLREAPTNNWSTSTGGLSPQARPGAPRAPRSRLLPGDLLSLPPIAATNVASCSESHAESLLLVSRFGCPAVRVLSLANEKHRLQAAPKWEPAPLCGTSHSAWKQVG